MNKSLIIFAALMIFMMGFWIPETRINPVVGLQFGDKQQRVSQVNEIKIVAKRNTPVVATTGGIVVYKQKQSNGTQTVTILGPKWRLHRYSHLKQVTLTPLQMVSAGKQLGVVAANPNRKRNGYVNYSIQSLSPVLSKLDTRVPEGWKRVFYVNPRKFLTQDGNAY